MKIVVLQPSYLPWLGYLDQYAWCDRFVLYDDVQYDKHGWRNRNRILWQGQPHWLTVPVHCREFPLIAEVRVDLGRPWRRKHLTTLEQGYARAPFFSWLMPRLRDYYSNAWDSLVDWNVHGLKWMCELLGMPWKGVMSSQLGVTGSGTERLVHLCRALGASQYLTGDAARDYLDEEALGRIGVEVLWHGYPHPTYTQGKGEHPFVSHLSVVDLLFWHGPDSLSILWQTRK